MSIHSNLRVAFGITTLTAMFAVSAFGAERKNEVLQGTDINNSTNPFVQPQDPALSGGGRDQTLKFGDQLVGDNKNDIIIGALGTDTMLGQNGHDILIGGPEHFNPENRDRAFGGKGNDIFIWKPGDGSDFFDGGKGNDTVIFGLLGENVGGQPFFGVSNDQQSAPVFLDEFNMPIVDVTNSPGFCEVIDELTSPGAAVQLEALDLDHLVQFFLKGVNKDFEDGVQSNDNGLRVTLHLKSVERLVCTDKDNAEIVAFDLTTTPPTQIQVADLPRRVLDVIQ